MELIHSMGRRKEFGMASGKVRRLSCVIFQGLINSSLLALVAGPVRASSRYFKR